MRRKSAVLSPRVCSAVAFPMPLKILSSHYVMVYTAMVSIKIPDQFFEEFYHPLSPHHKPLVLVLHSYLGTLELQIAST